VLGLPDEAEAADVEAAVASLDPTLIARVPLLATALGLPIPDNDLTAGFDGELGKTSREDLLARLLRARARVAPLAVVVDDAHWLDGIARDLLATVVRAVRGVPCLLVVTARPQDSESAPAIARGSHVTDLAMAPLGADASAALVTHRHRTLAGRDPSPTTVATVVSRAEGNPFDLVQLVDYLLGHEDDSDPDAHELPASLQTLVLSRIDAAPEGSRRAVKVASVVGRDFRSPLVARAYPDLGPARQVHADLVTMTRTRLIDLEDERAQQFAFGHAVTREVAYDSLPHGVRLVLHGRVGGALEEEPGGEERHLDLLAYHYARSDVLPKRRHYLLAAARAARAAYANTAAVAYLDLVLPQIAPDELPEVLLDLAEAQELSGDWAAAEATIERTLRAALDAGSPSHHARALIASADLARRQGRYTEAGDLLATAELELGEAGDEAGLARVLHLRGTLRSQQGDAAGARAAYEAGLEVRRRLEDDPGIAALLTNLALVAEDEGDLDAAERIGLDALARRRALGDRRAVSVSLMNMGMLATVRGELPLALERFTEALTLADEVGDPWLAAVGRHNVGNAARDTGDLASAAELLGHALAAYADYDDRWSLAHVLEDVALWLLARDGAHDHDAVALLAAAQAVREEIGAPRFPPTEAALEAALAPARARTPGLDETQGRAALVEDAVARAASVLADHPS
jgi:predicted ATPase